MFKDLSPKRPWGLSGTKKSSKEEKTLKKEDSASGLRVEARGITDSGRTGWNKEKRNSLLFPKGSVSTWSPVWDRPGMGP